MLKKIIPSLICVLLLFNTHMNVLAKTNDNNIISKNAPKEYTEFISKVFPSQIGSMSKHAIYFGLEENQMKESNLGNPFGSYKFISTTNSAIQFEDVYYYPVLYNNKIIATIAVTKSQNGSFNATFSKSFAENLQKLLDDNSNKNFKIINTENKIIAVNDENCYTLKEKENANIGIKNEALSEEQINKLFITNISSLKNDDILVDIKESHIPILRAEPGVPEDSASIDVPYIQNGEEGFCWACTCASIINYKNGENNSGEDISIEIKGKLTGGSNSDSCKAYRKHGLSAKTVGVLGYNTWTDYLKQDNPLDLALYHSYAFQHAVVLRGFEKYSKDDGGQLNYLLMDPNNGYVMETVSNVSSPFNYYMDGNNYKWKNTIIVK